MASTQAVGVATVHRPSTAQWRQWIGKNFYLTMALVIATIVVYAFSHTVDQNLIDASPRRPFLLWIHAVFFSGWVVFFIAQTALIRVRKVGLHRTLGWAGAALGVAMVVVGFWVAVVMARFETYQLHEIGRKAFLIVPLLDITAFATCFGLAILWRGKPEHHRRLMLIATCVLTAAAFGRIPATRSVPLLGFYGGVDGLILLGALRDLTVNRRVHAVYLTALPVLIVAQAATIQIFHREPALWMDIAGKLVR